MSTQSYQKACTFVMYVDTIMILSFRTDRSGQTVQTQIRLIRVYTICNSGCIFWVHYSLVKPSGWNFRVITANFWGVRINRIFTVTQDCLRKWKLMVRSCFVILQSMQNIVSGITSKLSLNFDLRWHQSKVNTQGSFQCQLWVVSKAKFG